MSVTDYSSRRAEDRNMYQRMSSLFGTPKRMIWWHIYDHRMPISIEFENLKRPEYVFRMCSHKVRSFARRRLGEKKKTFLSESFSVR